MQLDSYSLLVLTNPNWIFSESLSTEQKLWDVIDHVAFRNQRNHRTLAFSIRYYIVELKIHDLSPENSVLRAIICYGEQLGVMMNSINYFLKSQSQTNVFSCKSNSLDTKEILKNKINELLKQNLIFGDVIYLKYIPPFHKTQFGSWEKIDQLLQVE